MKADRDPWHGRPARELRGARRRTKADRVLFSKFIICVALLLTTSGCGDNSATGAGSIDAPFVFNPGLYAELTVKGLQPDGATSWGALTVPPPPQEFATPEFLARGQALYTQACTACHGTTGKGDGILGMKVEFNIPPANFTKPIYSINIRSTQMGTLPVDADLFRSVTRGMPGTAMMSYRDLPETDRWALVRAVKEFWAGLPLPAAVPVKIPAKIAATPELLQTGRDAYKICANCHGPTGLGGTAASYNKLTGKPYPAVAFSRDGGKSTFGGSTEDDIARTLLTGFGLSSPMMSVQAGYYGDNPTPRETEEGNRKLWAVVYCVRGMLNANGEK
jgi:mono/diheme cytochrome c family protein